VQEEVVVPPSSVLMPLASPSRLPGLVASKPRVPPSSLFTMTPSNPPLLPHPRRVSDPAATAAQSQRISLNTEVELCTPWISQQRATRVGTRLGRGLACFRSLA
jgi:hypothetical protein